MIPKRSVACCVLILVLWGCAGLKKPELHHKLPAHVAAADPETIVDRLERINQDLSSLKGIGRIKIWKFNKLQSTRMAWAGYRPEKLRLEILGITGRPLSSVAFDGKRLYLSLHAENQFYQRQTRHADLRRFISIPISIPDTLAILSGRVPLLANASASLEMPPLQDHCILTLKKNWFKKRTAKIYLGADLRTVRQYELYGAEDKLRYRVEYLQRKQYGAYQLPVALQISDDQHTRIQIEADRIWPDADVPSEMFVLKPPG